MKKLFYIGLLGLMLFELANVYFIMPLPGSQQTNSIDLAYFFYKWRWIFRVFFALLLLFGLFKSNWKRKWTISIPLLVLGAIVYTINFSMAADAMFKQPETITMMSASNNKVDTNRLIIGIEENGIAKAYPIQYLGYHHFVYDTLNHKPILVTYCTVCRTGRVFDPTVNGKVEKFRLVGMDHFNAMIEDATTKSWWRQSTGEAITGEMKGKQLKELQSSQTSLAQWLKLYPNSKIMQADASSIKKYDSTFKYESGKSKSKLTGTDSLSWKRKSWVIGIKLNKQHMVFDWNELVKKRVLTGSFGNTQLFVVLAKDNKSFFAFENFTNAQPMNQNDTIIIGARKFKLNGYGIDTAFNLKRIKAYQEFLHSWKAFQPD